MTATAFALEPALDRFDDVDSFTPNRPQLRVITGGRKPLDPNQVAAVAAQQASVEVIRRRRFVALMVVTTVIVAIAWLSGVSVTSFGGTAATDAASIDATPAVHMVLPGDSYAAIAASLGADNPVEAGQALQAANGGAELVVGQRLVVAPALLAASS